MCGKPITAMTPALPIYHTLQRTWKWLEDALFPPTCVGCSKRGNWCCAACLASLTFPRKQKCPSCGTANELGEFCSACQGKRALNGLWNAQPYGNPLVRNMVRAVKFEGVTELIPTLANLMAATLHTYALPPAWHKVPIEKWFICPVPLHPKRARTRGFNQSALIAAEVAEHAKIELKPVLERRRNTAPQSGLSHDEERSDNVTGAFTLTRGALVKGNAYILVDDVYTSGATLEECAKVLKLAGAIEVWGLTAAKG